MLNKVVEHSARRFRRKIPRRNRHKLEGKQQL